MFNFIRKALSVTEREGQGRPSEAPRRRLGAHNLPVRLSGPDDAGVDGRPPSQVAPAARRVEKTTREQSVRPHIGNQRLHKHVKKNKGNDK